MSQAERVEGGFVINARKVFASGAPVVNLLMTSAIYDAPDAGATVLHFAVPMSATGVAIESTWKAIGMRGTGSHDIVPRALSNCSEMLRACAITPLRDGEQYRLSGQLALNWTFQVCFPNFRWIRS